MTTIERLLEHMDEIGEKKIRDVDSNDAYNLNCAKDRAIDGLKAIGELLAEVGLACGRHGCKPVDEIPRETLWRVGELIEELAGIAEYCSEAESSIHVKMADKVSREGRG